MTKIYRLKEATQLSGRIYSDFQRIIQRLDDNQATLRLIQYILPHPEAQHCIHTVLRGNSLTILVDAAAWANRVRFHQTKILNSMNQLSRFAHLQTVIVRTDSSSTTGVKDSWPET